MAKITKKHKKIKPVKTQTFLEFSRNLKILTFSIGIKHLCTSPTYTSGY